MDEIIGCGGCEHGQGAGKAPLLGAMDRRELLKRGGLAAAALLLAACGASDGVTGISGGKLTVKLADFPQLGSNGGVAMVSSQVAVENNNGSYIALSRVCPHQGGQIQATGSGFQCPVHGATFDRTGQWVGGQRTSSMRRLNVTTNADGTLSIG